ncbi:MAG: type I restriction enzyme HsdR N-terminal domain-containing protein, partial [Bacteroidales bacterium]|nr:type I restriction enzyme HsdR N-terminal domain-containing protein [Bacteroidales bacterium]
SEVAFKHGAKEYRADIVVYDRTARPLMLIECKRPEVELNQEVIDQAIRYCNELEVKYIGITNGAKTFLFQRTQDGWEFMEKAPMWEEMAGRAGHDEL